MEIVEDFGESAKVRCECKNEFTVSFNENVEAVVCICDEIIYVPKCPKCNLIDRREDCPKGG